jgi:hypothetical protein
MDMPQLSRIDAHARVSAATRPDEAQAAHGSRGFSAQLIGEDAGGRRRRRAAPDSEPPPDQEVAPGAASGASDEPATEPVMEAVLEAEQAGDSEDILPEDAHDPQELRALLAAPPAD